jgi:esterase/lipase
MRALFLIENDLQTLFNQLEESEGLITPEQEQALVITRAELQQKSLNYVHFIKKMESDLELAKVYEEQVKAFKNRKQKTIDRLKESLLNAVTQFGDIETEIFTIKTRKSESVTITDENSLPVEAINVKTTRTPDKVKIKEIIKKEGSIPGAELTQNVSLAIK